MMNHDDAVAIAIDIEDDNAVAVAAAAATDIEEMMERVEPYETDDYCIYKVPFDIRRLNEDAYTPKFVSIGPFHQNRHLHLQNMEKYKLTYCKEFFKRTGAISADWISHIEGLESKIRSCYSDTLEFSKEQLVKIIFVDSGFIFEYFLRVRGFRACQTDNFLLNPKVSNLILLDLVILENQLPFFVLENLFNVSRGITNFPSFRELSIDCFEGLKTSHLPSRDYCNISIRHFTDLVRSFSLKHPLERGPRTHKSDELMTYFPSATELSEAGLRFKVNKKSRCILDLKFSGRVLEIPHLDVDDRFTEVLLRNIMALEQFLYPYETYITYYVKVLDLLVNTSKDVDIMVRQGILTNWLGDTDSVAKLFNGLLQNITICNSSPCYFRISKDLNAFYTHPWNNLKSTLKRNYCSSPWQTAGTIAAIVLLILSLVQSVCSVLQVL